MSPLGILMLDTTFPRLPGDVGCAETFAFPVRYARVKGATVDEVVHHHDRTRVPDFVAAGRQLADEGCAGIATTCGFLARWQDDLAQALPVPVLSSALLQVPLVARTLPAGQRVGIVTYSASSLTPDTLAAAGVSPCTPLEGVDPAGYFASAIRTGSRVIAHDRMQDDTVAAAQRLVAAHRDIGAVVLECANMPPYAAAVKVAVGVPVFDAAELIRWFHAGVTGTPIRHPARDLW